MNRSLVWYPVASPFFSHLTLPSDSNIHTLSPASRSKWLLALEFSIIRRIGRNILRDCDFWLSDALVRLFGTALRTTCRRNKKCVRCNCLQVKYLHLWAIHGLNWEWRPNKEHNSIFIRLGAKLYFTSILYCFKIINWFK